MSIKRFDHVGVTVSDLDSAIAFFEKLGLEPTGPRVTIEGEFIDTVTGIPNARSEIVMLAAPGGETTVELSSFHHPDHTPGSTQALANEIGLRSIAFEVDDIDAAVNQLAADGYSLVGGIGQYENAWRMAYVRGPDGITVALAQQL
ncbi:VOC family protein [Nocardia camponoti]|nr:VOC family protein [Nocardia camponoti]